MTLVMTPTGQPENPPVGWFTARQFQIFYTGIELPQQHICTFDELGANRMPRAEVIRRREWHDLQVLPGQYFWLSSRPLVSADDVNELGALLALDADWLVNGLLPLVSGPQGRRNQLLTGWWQTVIRYGWLELSTPYAGARHEPPSLEVVASWMIALWKDALTRQSLIAAGFVEDTQAFKSEQLRNAAIKSGLIRFMRLP